MEKMRALWLRFRGVFVRRKAIEFEAELDSHIAMDTDDAMRSGLGSGGPPAGNLAARWRGANARRPIAIARPCRPSKACCKTSALLCAR